MITRYGLYCDNFKARFYNVQLPKPDKDGYQVVLTDELLAEWESKATEIVECETLDYAEWYGESADCDAHFPLNILRIKHEDGTFSVEPVYKLFPINSGHAFYRNSLLRYCDVDENLKYTADFNEGQMNAPIREWLPEWKPCILDPRYKRQLQFMYCRKYDINMVQAGWRTACLSPEQWVKEFNGNYDTDFCWVWCP